MRKGIIAFTLIFLAILALDAYPGLRGGAGWRWTYDLVTDTTRILPLVVVLLAYMGGVLWLRRRSAAVWMSLGWAFAGAVAVSVTVVAVRGDPGFLLFTRTVSPVQTGATSLAVNIMAEDGAQVTLKNWTDVMRQARDVNLIHFTTSPPGQPLIHYGLAQIVGHSLPDVSLALRLYQCSDPFVMHYTRGELVSTIFGMMMPLWAALAVFPVYIAGRQLTDDAHAATRIASWWALIPTIALFAPTWNTVYPFLCVSSFALLLIGLQREQHGFTFLAGVVMSLTTFLNFAVLPVLLLFGLFTLGYVFFVRERDGLWSALRFAVIAGIWYGIGLLSVWIVYYLLFGVSVIEILQVTFDSHNDLVQRDYLPWIVLHAYDTLLFVGWVVAGLFLWGVWRAVQAKQRNATHILALAMLITFIAVNLSGVAQGENGRILSFYAPFLLLAGAGLFVDKTWWDMPLMGAQAMTVLVMALALSVVPLDLNRPPSAPSQDVPRLDWLEPRPVGAVFTGEDYIGRFALESHRFVADLAQQSITLETIWQGDQRTERPYQFEVIARAENEQDGEIISEPHRWYPQNSGYLTTCWREDDTIHDVTVIPLPPVSMPVVWTLELRVRDPRTGDFAGIVILDPVSYP